MDANAALQRLRNFEHVIDTMHCGLVAEDLDGTMIFVNQRLVDWLGYPPEELEGEHVFKLVPPELKDLIDEDERAIEKGDLRARLLAIRRSDGTTFPVVAIPQQFLDPKGALEGFFHIIIDLGAVMTARPVGSPQPFDVRTTLARIAVELHSISLAAGAGAGSTLPLGHPELAGLSQREAEVLSLLMAGDRVPAIAERLCISQHTVRNHLKSMFRKVGVGRQAELIAKVRFLAEAPAPSAGAPA